MLRWPTEPMGRGCWAITFKWAIARAEENWSGGALALTVRGGLCQTIASTINNAIKTPDNRTTTLFFLSSAGAGSATEAGTFSVSFDPSTVAVLPEGWPFVSMGSALTGFSTAGLF